MGNGREIILEAFDRLFAKAAGKLHVSYTPAELADARKGFERRFAPGLEMIAALNLEKIPPEVLEEMEQAIDSLSTADLVGHLASIPLIHKAQEVLRLLTYRAAQQRLLEHALEQADNGYGGN